ncbi:MAG TPA: orotidine-5'-phosphate decarboxylase, partial [Firmicutes bacterium]|nr:orotidine-5'-phosphate decarboxylase [Bacillota bacterium]
MGDLLTARERLVYALDAEGMGEARRWVERLRAWVGVFK